MSAAAPELSPNLQRISGAIQGHGGPVYAVFCGFDLYLEVISSPFMSTIEIVTGGRPADGTEPEGILKVPMQALGGRYIVSYDPTIPPDQFYLRP